jgi:hypothetical protein
MEKRKNVKKPNSQSLKMVILHKYLSKTNNPRGGGLGWVWWDLSLLAVPIWQHPTWWWLSTKSYKNKKKTDKN